MPKTKEQKAKFFYINKLTIKISSIRLNAQVFFVHSVNISRGKANGEWEKNQGYEGNN
jgi:hypothetical protein